MKWHYQPDGAWQLTHAEYCGSRSINGVRTTRDVEFIDCMHCLKKMKKEGIKQWTSTLSVT